MKPWINGNPVTAKYGILRLVEIVQGHAYGFGWNAPKILIVSPPALSPTDNVEFQKLFLGGEAASRELARHYAEVSGLMGCGFFDAGSVAKTTPARWPSSRRREHAGHRPRASAGRAQVARILRRRNRGQRLRRDHHRLRTRRLHCSHPCRAARAEDGDRRARASSRHLLQLGLHPDQGAASHGRGVPLRRDTPRTMASRSRAR